MKIRKYKLWQTSYRSCINWKHRIKSKKNGTVLKIYNNGILIGNVIFYDNDNVIYNLSINPKYQFKGYGSMLLKAAEKEIFKKFNEVKLTPQDNDESLRLFYSKNGYTGFDERDEGYEEEDKTWWIMTKRK